MRKNSNAILTGPWQVEEESNNNTCWRYAVAYECGALCVGRATVAACDANARLSHGASDRHRVQFSDRRCWGLPALSWPRLCESLETDSVIGPRAEGGAWLEEQAYVQCSLLATVVGHCDVHAARLLHHRALREALG
ncbi:jg10817 [Pararge aegeria aegeria]|uniref:Jg10817 protein n=1 Tax=Pararge aegeria aegeria TaxID=348720 RepID=A0A8S4QX78_9NEOP|nr:jg10817 [Pararge aegeria aegeria]